MAVVSLPNDMLRVDPSGILGPTPLVATASAVMMTMHDRELRSELTPQPFDTWGDAWNTSAAAPTEERDDGLMAVWHRLAMAISVAVLVWLGGACSFVFRERMCSPGERAVRAIEAADTGRTCVKKGQPPPPGYEEFPPGQRPTYVDQDR